ncbi:hypothetical protein L596_015426 [Steinernema carpocapsae]|uniref:SAM-dependent MTase TRM10-type domain-containing protein n=1 Tax=Steinernema carpocapsae TaxID=34508 RepID=A0A4U5NFT7_STECR|nr:hypothetical protein L596_015426 [Steinernema carpocapsae]
MIRRSQFLRFLCHDLPACSYRRGFGVGMPPPTRGEGFEKDSGSKFEVFGDKLNVELPTAVLPPKELIDSLKKTVQQERLAQLISELTLIYKLSPEVPRKLTLSQWQRYYGLVDLREREDFLYTLHYEEIDEKRRRQLEAEDKENRERISEKQQVLYDNGEMVYARRFHELHDIRGQEFRKQIDHMYGSRLLAQERTDERMPQLIVDCQFLSGLQEKQMSSFVRQIQSLHDRNWFHRNPFRITLANMTPHHNVARLMKRYWTFHFGPQKAADLSFAEMDEMNFDMEMMKADANFKAHPMAPRITSLRMKEAIDSGVHRSQIAYISSTANNYLDGPLDRFKTFILCTSLDHNSWTSSLHAALGDKIPAYRLPFDRYVRWRKGGKVLPLCNQAEILRDVYTGARDWKSAILTHVPEYHLAKQDELPPPVPNSKLTPDRVKKLERQQRLEIIDNIMKSSSLRKMDASAPKKPRRDEERAAKPPRIMVHRYSREERNRRRKAEAEAKASSNASN